MEELGPQPVRPVLAGDLDVDVCIVGGGYTGLWTAYELRRADPSVSVAVLEARHAGFGASGRNGGWVVGELAGSLGAWRSRPGHAALARAINDTVAEVGDVAAREGIDCGFVHGGSLRIARSRTELTRLQDPDAEQLGGEDSVLLSAAELRERVRVDGALGGSFNPHCARIQPARLVAGLAAAVEHAGATIYERTPVRSIATGCAITEHARVRAGVVVRATEGYTTSLPGSRRTLLPMNSSMILTEPLAEELWAQIGWEGAETMSDGAHRYAYLQRTVDGRIAIGGRGSPYRFASKTDREGPVPEATVAELRARLLTLFPMLGEVAIAAAWHGVLGVARDWMPAVGYAPGAKLAWAGGYVGDGVAASNLAGRTLRDLILGRDSELTRLPWVGPLARDWEPEPLRFIGTHLVYGLYRAADWSEARTDRPSRFATVADLIAGR